MSGTAPAAPPPLATRQDLRDWLGPAMADGVDDAVLDRLLRVATRQVVAWMEWHPGLHRAEEWYEGLGADALFTRRRPVAADPAPVAVDGRGEAVPMRPRADDQVGRADGGRPFGRGERIRLSYTAGFEPMREDIAAAVCIQAQAVLSAPAFDPNLPAESIGGVVSGSVGPQGAGGVGAAVRDLLRPYKRMFPIA